MVDKLEVGKYYRWTGTKEDQKDNGGAQKIGSGSDGDIPFTVER